MLSYSPSVQHVKNTNVMVQCEECLMWRLFSKRKLTLPQQKSLETVMADISYSCRALFYDLNFPAGLESTCVRDHHCGDPIEKLYYSAGYDLICASESVVSSIPEDYYPLCASCLEREHVKKRNK